MPMLETAAGRLCYFDNAPAEAGAPTVLLLHSSAASHRQWRALIAQLGQRWRVIAPDLIGYGGTPMMPQSPIMADEVALLCGLLDGLDGPVHLVGHSYGGVVALELARARPQRIAALAVYEPVAFGLLRETTRYAAWREIALLAKRHIELVEAREPFAAARAFLDYWIAKDALLAMPDAMQAYIVGCMTKVAAEWRMFLGGAAEPDDYRALTMPVLLLCGGDTTPAARGVVAELRRRLPAPRLLDLPGLGHMAPLLQPDLVNPAIINFLNTSRLCLAGTAKTAEKSGTGVAIGRFAS
jgi:pimeloyl-ACP methyl ester carboxylesterase